MVNRSYPDGNTSNWDRFLAHVDDLEEHRLEAFIRMINRAKRRGLANLRAVVIAPLLDANLTDVDGEILDDLQDKFEIVAHPDNIDVQRHPDNVAWFLTIDGDKTFTYGKDGSSSGEDEDDEDEEGHEDENGEDDDDSEDDENSEE